MLVKNSFLLRHKKLIAWSIFLCLIICIGAFAFFKFRNSRQRAVFATSSEMYTVAKGDIATSITGSGVIESSNTKDILSEVSADVKNVYIKVGDSVKKGDVLFELDRSTYDSQIRSAQKTVTNHTKNVSEYVEDIKNLNVYADTSGYVTELSLKVGDSVSKNAKILNLIEDKYYYLECTFNYNSNVDIEVGNRAVVQTSGSYTTFEGVVSFVSAYTERDDESCMTQRVIIEIPNPGYTLAGISAQATVYTDTKSLRSNNFVTITEADSYSQKSLSSGTVETLEIKNGDYINKGDLIMVLSNDSLLESLSDAQTDLSNAYEDLNDIKDTNDFYTITAPIDGVISEINYSEGDYVREESVLATIINTSDLEFSISVDELEILDVEIGQEVDVTIDALEETATTPLKGYVSEIALSGTSQNSVSTYPVIISLSGDEKIKIGFNCSASILTSSAKDVIVVPVEAVSARKGKYSVTLEDGSVKEIEVGIYDEDNIEVKSGLEVGDVIKLPEIIKVDESNDSKMSEGRGSMGGMSFPGGGMGGSMPSMGGGGFPGGGSMPMGF